MGKDTLIRTVCGGKVPREFKLAALIGDFFERLEKHYGVAEIADPDLKEKLTEEELQLLYAKFKYLDPNRVIPAMPTHGAIPFRNASPVPVPPPSEPNNPIPVPVPTPTPNEGEIVTEPIQVETKKRGRKPANK
jgi:hypothetical protein